MWTKIKTLAGSLGFARVYSLLPQPIAGWEERGRSLAPKLQADPETAYPRATAVLLLAYPYASYPQESRLPSYYIGSNAAYFAAQALCREIAQTHYCEQAEIPLRAFAVQAGVGQVGKNGLLRIEDLGSRFALMALATDACGPVPFTDATPPCPPECTACAAACPTGAIGERGLAVERCMRLAMDTADHPDWVRELQQRFLGCERCLDGCIYNEGSPSVSPPPPIQEAFDLARLIQGDAGAARRLAGKNMTGGGKLIAEAIVFAAKERILHDLIKKAGVESPYPAVHSAVKWAEASHSSDFKNIK